MSYKIASFVKDSYLVYYQKTPTTYYPSADPTQP